MIDIWDGQWVTDHVGITLDSELDGAIRGYVGLALRRNPKRAHLLVSHFLGKHIPVDPRAVYGVGLKLGQVVAEALAGESALVLGYAETATGLGHAVADMLDAPFLHSTRRSVPGVRPVGGFEEEHSHASGHLLLPEDPELLAGGRPLVLVDDELSTGRTAANTIRALHAAHPRELYVVASLVDVRGEDRNALMEALADELSIGIVVAAGCPGTISLPPDVLARAERAIATHAGSAVPAREPNAVLTVLEDVWPVGVRDGGRHGFGHDDRRQSAIAARGVAARLAEQPLGERVLVLGCEELMHAPLLTAVTLAGWAADSQSVQFSSTTRSPVLAIDEPGYAIRTALTFPAHDDSADGPGPRFAYNVAPAAGAEPFTDIVLMLDDVADTAELHADDGLIGQLAGVCERVYVVVLPSYRPGVS